MICMTSCMSCYGRYCTLFLACTLANALCHGAVPEPHLRLPRCLAKSCTAWTVCASGTGNKGDPACLTVGLQLLGHGDMGRACSVALHTHFHTMPWTLAASAPATIFVTCNWPKQQRRLGLQPEIQHSSSCLQQANVRAAVDSVWQGGKQARWPCTDLVPAHGQERRGGVVLGSAAPSAQPSLLALLCSGASIGLALCQRCCCSLDSYLHAAASS